MKKIVSAMALGALVLGAASAETKISINYRNGMNVYSGASYIDGGAGDFKHWFDQDGYNGGKDSVTLTASGDVFNFKTIVQPQVVSNDLVANCVEFGAKVPVGPGTLHAAGGWWADGISNGNIRITTDGSNFEGLDWEGNKPGSIFKGRPNTFVTNKVDVGLGIPYIAGYADYTLPTDALTLNVLASVITDRDDNTALGTKEDNAGAYSWVADVNVKVPSVLEVELIAKGSPKWNALKKTDGDYAGAYAFGLYAMPLMVDGLKLAVGGSLGMIDGLSDIAADLRANFKVNDSLSLTTYHNISVVKKVDGTDNSEDYGQAQLGRDYWGSANADKGSAEKGNTAMWNMLGLAYKVNDTLTARLSLEHQRMLARNESKKGEKDDYNLGSEIRVTPACEFTATKGASILAGVSVAVRGLGSDDEVYGKSADLYVGVPVLFRVKM